MKPAEKIMEQITPLLTQMDTKDIPEILGTACYLVCEKFNIPELKTSLTEHKQSLANLDKALELLKTKKDSSIWVTKDGKLQKSPIKQAKQLREVEKALKKTKL